MALTNRFSPEDQDFLVKKYEEGASVRDIAKLMQCSQPTAAKYLRRWGAEIRPQGGNQYGGRSFKFGTPPPDFPTREVQEDDHSTKEEESPQPKRVIVMTDDLVDNRDW